MNAITQQAMLVNLHIGMWTGAKTDKGAASETAKRNNARDGSVNVIKYLVPKEVIQPLETARNSVRTHLLDRTLPWNDNGDRLLPRKLYQKFIDEHSPLEQAFVDAADAFKQAYMAVRDQAEFNLGSLFNIDDYPHPDEVRRRSHCRLDIAPIPSVGDFRVDLDQDAVDMIRAQIEEQTTARIFEAQKSVWGRIETAVTHFASRMEAQIEGPQDGKRRPPLHQSMIDNMVNLVNALPALNIVGDPGMNKIGKRLHGLLSSYNDVDSMKGNAAVCAAARQEVDDIMDEMAGYANAFGSN